MRNVMYGFFLSMILVLMIILSIVFTQRNFRDDELKNALSDSTEKAIERVNLSQDFVAYSDEEYVAAVIEYMLKDIKSNAKNIDPDSLKITIEVARVDREKGLIAMNVVEEFTQLNGTVGHVETQVVGVLDTESNRINHTVKILTPDKNVWKTFSVKDGDPMPEFTDLPTGFIAYTDLDGRIVDLEETVTTDLTYIMIRESVVCDYYDDRGELYLHTLIYAGDEIPVPISPTGSDWKNADGTKLTAGTKAPSGSGILNYYATSTRTWNVVYKSIDGTTRSYDIPDGGLPVIPINTNTEGYTTNGGTQSSTTSYSMWYYADESGDASDTLLDGSKPIHSDVTFVEKVVESSTVPTTSDYENGYNTNDSHFIYGP